MELFKLYNLKDKFSEKPPEIGEYITITFPPIDYNGRRINIVDSISGFVDNITIKDNDNGTASLYSIDLLKVIFLQDYINDGESHQVIPVTIKMQNDFNINSRSKEIKRKS